LLINLVLASPLVASAWRVVITTIAAWRKPPVTPPATGDFHTGGCKCIY